MFRDTKLQVGRRAEDAAVIQLLAGTYHLAETVVLGVADSGLTITAYQNDVRRNFDINFPPVSPISHRYSRYSPSYSPPPHTRRVMCSTSLF